MTKNSNLIWINISSHNEIFPGYLGTSGLLFGFNNERNIASLSVFMSSPSLGIFSFFNNLSFVTQLPPWARELLHKHAPHRAGAFQDKGRTRRSSGGRARVLVSFPFCFKLIHKHSNQLKTSDLWERSISIHALRSAWFDWDVNARMWASMFCALQVVRCHVKLHGWSECLSLVLLTARHGGGGLIDGYEELRRAGSQTGWIIFWFRAQTHLHSADGNSTWACPRARKIQLLTLWPWLQFTHKNVLSFLLMNCIVVNIPWPSYENIRPVWRLLIAQLGVCACFGLRQQISEDCNVTTNKNWPKLVFWS